MPGRSGASLGALVFAHSETRIVGAHGRITDVMPSEGWVNLAGLVHALHACMGVLLLPVSRLTTPTASLSYAHGVHTYICIQIWLQGPAMHAPRGCMQQGTMHAWCPCNTGMRAPVFHAGTLEDIT